MKGAESLVKSCPGLARLHLLNCLGLQSGPALACLTGRLPLLTSLEVNSHRLINYKDTKL